MYAAAAAASSSGTAIASTSASPPPPRPSRNTAVIYRSSALAATAPGLVSAVDSRESARVPSIAKAHALAEDVREKFKKRGRGKTRKEDDSKNISLDSEEAEKAGRYDRRLKMNRQSAAASRVRREAYIKALESQLVEGDKHQRELEAALEAERAANARLRQSLLAGGLLPAPSPPAPPDVSESSGVPAGAQDVCISPQDIPLPVSDFASQMPEKTDAPPAVSPNDDVLQLDEIPGATVTAPYAAALDAGVKYEPLPVLPEEFLTAFEPVPRDEFAGIDFAQAPFPFTEVDPESPKNAIDELLNLPAGL